MDSQFTMPANIADLVYLHHDLRYHKGGVIKDEWFAHVPGGCICETGKTAEDALQAASAAYAKYVEWKAKPKRKLTKEEIEYEIQKEFAGEKNPNPREVAMHRSMLKDFFCVVCED